MFSWVSSAFTSIGGGWFTGKSGEKTNTNSWEKNENNDDDKMNQVQEKIINEPEIELTEEEKTNLILIQSKIEQELKEPSIKASSKHTIHHVHVRIHSIKCQLIQHIEYPNHIGKQYFVVPHPLIRIVIDDIQLKQVSRNKQTRLHFSIENIVIEDLWSKETLFPEILQSPITSIYKSSSSTSSLLEKDEKSQPAFHAHFYIPDSRRGTISTLNIQMESIQFACPPVVLRQIIQFLQTMIQLFKTQDSGNTDFKLSDDLNEKSQQEENNLVEEINNDNSNKNIEKQDDNLLLNDISNLDTNINDKDDEENENWEILNSKLYTNNKNSEPLSNTTTNNNHHQFSTSISIEMKTIHFLLCQDFDKKGTEIIVFHLQNSQFHFHPQHTDEVITTNNSTIYQISLYSTNLPSYLCDSTSERFYFIQPFDCEISLRFYSFLNPIKQHPKYDSLNHQQKFFPSTQNEIIYPYHGCISIDISFHSLICGISNSKINLLQSIINKILLTFSSSNENNYFENSMSIKSKPTNNNNNEQNLKASSIFCNWKPIYNITKKSSLKKPHSDDLNSSYLFTELNISLNQFSLFLLDDFSKKSQFSSVGEFLIDEISCSIDFYKTIDNQSKQDINFDFYSFQFIDFEKNPIIISDVSQSSSQYFNYNSNNLKNSNSYFTPLYTPLNNNSNIHGLSKDPLDTPDIFSTPLSSNRTSLCNSVDNSDHSDSDNDANHFHYSTTSFIDSQSLLSFSDRDINHSTSNQTPYHHLSSVKSILQSGTLKRKREFAIQLKLSIIKSENGETKINTDILLSHWQIMINIKSFKQIIEVFPEITKKQEQKKQEKQKKQKNKLTKEEKLWKILYIKMVFKIRNKFKKQSFKNGIPCIRFPNWPSFIQSTTLINSNISFNKSIHPKWKKVLAKSNHKKRKLNSYFEKINIHFSKSLFVIPDLNSNSNSNSKIHIIIPKIDILSPNDDHQIHKLINMKLNIPIIVAFLYNSSFYMHTNQHHHHHQNEESSKVDKNILIDSDSNSDDQSSSDNDYDFDDLFDHYDKSILKIKQFQFSILKTENDKNYKLKLQCDEFKIDISPNQCAGIILIVLSFIKSLQSNSSSNSLSTNQNKSIFIQFDGILNKFIIKQRTLHGNTFSRLFIKYTHFSFDNLSSISCKLTIQSIRLREILEKQDTCEFSLIIYPNQQNTYLSKRGGILETGSLHSHKQIQLEIHENEENNSKKSKFLLHGNITGYNFRWEPNFTEKEIQFFNEITNIMNNINNNSNKQQQNHQKSSSSSSSVVAKKDFTTMVHISLFKIKDTNLFISNGKENVNDKIIANCHLGKIEINSFTSIDEINAKFSNFEIQIENKENKIQALLVENFNCKINFSSIFTIYIDLTGLQMNISSFILSKTNELIQSFTTKTTKSTNDEISHQNDHKKSSSNSIHIDGLFRRSSISFLNDHDNKEIIYLFFSLFQILKVKNENKNLNFISLAFDEGEVSILDNKNNSNKILHGFSSTTKQICELPGVLSTSSAYCAWIWKKNEKITDIQFSNLHGNFKSFFLAFNKVYHIISSSFKSSSNKNQETKEIIIKKPKKQIQKQFKIKLNCLLLEYCDIQSINYYNSSIICKMEEIFINILYNNKQQENNKIIESIIQYIGFSYKFKTKKQNLFSFIQLFEMYGNSILLSQEIKENKLLFDITAITGNLPLPIIREFQLYISDFLNLLETIKKQSKSKNNSKIQITNNKNTGKNKNFYCFNNKIIKEFNPSLLTQWNEKDQNQSFIYFSNSNFISFDSAKKQNFNGYYWRGDQSIINHKEIIWFYKSSSHKIRRLTWINESFSPRCSVIILQYFHFEKNEFIDLLSPIENNCASNDVNLIIDSSISSKCWKLIFKCPEKLKKINQKEINNNNDYWPWISSFQIYSDEEELNQNDFFNKNENSEINSIDNDKSISLKLSFSIGKCKLSLLSSLQSKDNILFVLTCQLLLFDCLFIQKKSKKMKISGLLQLDIDIEYQDFSLMCMRKFISISPRLYVAYSHERQFSLLIHQNYSPVIQFSRTSLQLLRNLSFYLSKIYKSIKEKQNENSSSELNEMEGLFSHFRIHNHTGQPIHISEIYNDQILPHHVRIGSEENIYWKWSMIHSSSSSSSSKLSGRGVKLQLEDENYVLSPINISSIGNQILCIHNNNDKTKKIFILLKVHYPITNNNENNKNSNISKILEAEFIASYQITSFISIPLQIQLPRIKKQQKNKPIHQNNPYSNVKQIKINENQENNENIINLQENKYSSSEIISSIYFSCIENTKEDNEFHLLYFKEFGDNNHWKSIKIYKNKSFSNLIKLREFNNQIEQYIRINIQIEKITSEFSIKKIIFSPIFILRNEISLPLKYKIVNNNNYCISEGLLKENEIISLYHSSRNKNYLQLTSGYLNNDSCIWTPTFDISCLFLPNQLNQSFHLEIDSGIGIYSLQKEIFCSSVPLEISIFSKIIDNLNIKEISIQIPFIIENKTDEGLFICEMNENNNEIIYQLYIPPKYSLPLPKMINDHSFQSNINIFHYLSGNNISQSLRNTTEIHLDSYSKLVGFNPLHSPGNYNAGYCKLPDNDNNISSHQYIINISKNSSISTNKQRKIEIFSPFQIKNQLSHTIIIEKVWPSNYEPNIPLHDDDLLKHSIEIQSNQIKSLNHWISNESIIYSGKENISFFLRYDGIGWEEIECNMDYISRNNKQNHYFHLKNSLTQQHDRIQILFIPFDNHNQRNSQILIVPAPNFPFSFINFTKQKLYLLIQQNNNKEIKIQPCSSVPLDSIENKNRKISIAIRLSKRHLWSDFIIIERSRKILISLFGPNGSEAIEITITYSYGSASIYFRSFNSSSLKNKFSSFSSDHHQNTIKTEQSSSHQDNHLGYFLTKSTISSKSFKSNMNSSHSIDKLSNLPILSNTIKALHDNDNYSLLFIETKNFLSNLFPSNHYPGIYFQIITPNSFISFSNEQGDKLMEFNSIDFQFTCKYYLPQSNSICMNLSFKSLTLCNYLEESHFPIQWTDNTNTNTNHAFQLNLQIPFPFEGHLQKISCSISPVIVQLSGSFVSNILQHSPAWISAIKNPTQISTKISTTKNSTTKKITNQNLQIYVNEFQISPCKIEISWTNISKISPKLISIPSNLFSVSHLRLHFSGVNYSDFPRDLNEIIRGISKRYLKDLLWQIFPTIGSIDLLGNPSFMIRQIRHYFTSFIKIRSQNIFTIRGGGNNNNNELQDFTNSSSPFSSLIFGIFASIVDCSICFTRAIRDSFCSFNHLRLLQNSPYLIADSASEQLKLFLHAARISLEEATRNTLTKPIDGYYSNGINGLLKGTQQAITGWSVPCEVGLEVQLRILRFLREWLLKNNSLPPLITSEENLKIQLLHNFDHILKNNDIQDEFSLLSFWYEILPFCKEDNNTFFCTVKKVTFQYNTEILHDRNLLLASSFIYIANGTSIVLAVPFDSLNLIETHQNHFITFYFTSNSNNENIKSQIIIDDAIVNNNHNHTSDDNSNLLLVKLYFSNDTYYSSFLLFVLTQFKKITGHSLPHKKICVFPKSKKNAINLE